MLVNVCWRAQFKCSIKEDLAQSPARGSGFCDRDVQWLMHAILKPETYLNTSRLARMQVRSDQTLESNIAVNAGARITEHVHDRRYRHVDSIEADVLQRLTCNDLSMYTISREQSQAPSIHWLAYRIRCLSSKIHARTAKGCA